MNNKSGLEMEEGEIQDSGDEACEKVTSQHYQSLQPLKEGAVKNKNANFPLRLKESESDESEEDIDCNNDDDDIESNFNNDNQVGGTNNVANTNFKESQKKNKLSVWSSVLQDQLLSGDLKSWSGVNKSRDMNRSVENYDYSRAAQDERPQKQMKFDSECSTYIEEDHCTDVANLDQVETFGVLSEQTKGNLKNSSFDDARSTIEERRRKKATRRLSQKNNNNDCKYDRRILEMMPINKSVFVSTLPVPDVATELLTILREPKHMKSMFETVVTVIGTERTFQLLLKTEDVEKSGGLMTVGGSRRRTPGGSFLWLLKSEADKVELDKIFVQEKEERISKIKSAKEKKRLLLAEKTKKLAAELSMSKSVVSSSNEINLASNVADTTENDFFDELESDNIELDF